MGINPYLGILVDLREHCNSPEHQNNNNNNNKGNTGARKKDISKPANIDLDVWAGGRWRAKSLDKSVYGEGDKRSDSLGGERKKGTKGLGGKIIVARVDGGGETSGGSRGGGCGGHGAVGRMRLLLILLVMVLPLLLLYVSVRICTIFEIAISFQNAGKGRGCSYSAPSASKDRPALSFS